MSEHACPAWVCPICDEGKIRLRKNSRVSVETERSKQNHAEDFWGPEFVVYAFTAWADCNHEPCKQAFAISGKGGVDQYPDERGEVEYAEYFDPLSIFPMPHIIKTPQKCPDSIKDTLQQSFVLFLSDRESCANKLRVCVELLLTHVGVPPDRVLHNRITKYKETSEPIADRLMALKWLGNTGSHGGEDLTISSRELLDAYEILENVFEELLEKKTERLNALARKLTNIHSTKKAP